MNPRTVLTGYRFLFAAGSLTAGFQSIGGVGGQVEAEYIHEGGRHDCAYPIPSAAGKTGRLVFEKGHGLYNPFYGAQGFQAGTRLSVPCSILVYGEDRQLKRVFAFDNGLIVSWEAQGLAAGQAEVLIDKVEIEHTGLYEIGQRL